MFCNRLNMKYRVMENISVSITILLIAFLLSGCKRGTPTEHSQPKALAEKNGAALVPLHLDLPKENPFIDCSHPVNLKAVKHLEPNTDTPRDPFLVPQGVKNLALNKPVTSSQSEPIIGTLDMIVDGDKGMLDKSLVELGPSAQWIMIDLEKEYELYAIVFWHYYKYTHVYCDVAVQVSNEPKFDKGATTLFNNDIDNSLGLGAGQDMHYIDKAEGKLVDAKGTKARYVKLWSRGSNQAKDYTHYIEVEVYGK